MERITTNSVFTSELNALNYEDRTVEFVEEAVKMEELSCSLLLKNLLMNNLKLVKLNELGAMLFF